ncbi:Tho complex subunit 7-domain-containing protein [Xylariaceae sp. FL0016]|nr:Tho complex subunit 7-domain-containing protein [Xylariaceae sp. FL0016]
MATQQYGLLEEQEENELHKTRLLNVEERPFKRLTKRLLAPGAFTNPRSKLPTPPPTGNDDAAEATAPQPDIAALKEDIVLDFAAFDSAIQRLQLLANANAAERERYVTDRQRILGTMENVKESNAALKTQLDGARATLAQRKTFDELADRITSNRMLRTRAEQEVNLAKLAEECEELRRESEAYGTTWRERREQFERLVDEGKRLRALIRDEKEEAERKEGMDSDAEDGEAGDSQIPGKGSASAGATPGPENTAGAKGEGSALPAGVRDERTPQPDGAEALKPQPGASGSFSRDGSQAPSARGGSQQPEKESAAEDGEDVEMDEPSAPQQSADTPMAEETQGNSQETAATPQITIDAPEGNEDKMDTT